jgi:hypothetical protein
MSRPKSANSIDSGRPRVVVLGASNVTRGISTIYETARLAVGGPIDLYAAFGHGRSLGLHTRVLGRGLCGLLDAGLWSALDDDSKGVPRSRGSFALLSDIGNDLLYGVDPEKIGDWIKKILDRCQSVAQRVVVTELPLASIAQLGERRYRIVRRAIFPSCRLTFEEAQRGAIAVNEMVHRAAAERGAIVVPHDAAWYGFDPIHIRFSALANAWSTVLRSWRDDADGEHLARGSLARWWRLRTFSPEKRAFFGIERNTVQPAGKLRDGSRVWLY